MKDLLHWHLPDENDRGSHVLLVHRSLPFGGVRATAFFVDKLIFHGDTGTGKPFAVEGVRYAEPLCGDIACDSPHCKPGATETVVMVPGEAAYMLIERKRVSLASMVEIMRHYNAERLELKAAEKEFTGNEHSGDECPPGCTHDQPLPQTLLNPTGQYL